MGNSLLPTIDFTYLRCHNIYIYIFGLVGDKLRHFWKGGRVYALRSTFLHLKKYFSKWNEALYYALEDIHPQNRGGVAPGPVRAHSFLVSILLASSPTLCLASPVPTQLLLRCRTAHRTKYSDAAACLTLNTLGVIRNGTLKFKIQCNLQIGQLLFWNRHNLA